MVIVSCVVHEIVHGIIFYIILQYYYVSRGIIYGEVSSLLHAGINSYQLSTINHCCISTNCNSLKQTCAQPLILHKDLDAIVLKSFLPPIVPANRLIVAKKEDSSATRREPQAPHPPHTTSQTRSNSYCHPRPLPSRPRYASENCREEYAQ